jgi:hypothetical protein
MIGWSALAVFAEEKVDNPEYKHWAQFKVGSFSQLKMLSTMMGTKTETLTTTTLMELTAEKAVVEMKMVNEVMGQKSEIPATKRDIPAKIEKKDLPDLDLKKGKLPDGTEVLEVKKGKEDIKIGDKKIATEWVETKMKKDDSTITSKAWTSEEIPGRIVKTSTKMEGPMPTESEGVLGKFKADKGGKPEKAGDADKGEAKDKDEAKDKKDAKPEAGAKETKKAGEEKDEKKDKKH